MEILKGNFLVNAKEEAVISTEIFRTSDYVGLYFSASWCPPCQSFLPLLKKIYEQAQDKDIKFEIIFVPADWNNAQMLKFFVKNHGPWFTLPVGTVPGALRKKMQVYVIPTLIILDNKGRLITRNGKEDAENLEDPLKVWFASSDSKNSKNSSLKS